MAADLAMDAEACAFSFSNFDMAMDDLPSGGVLDDDAVQLDGLTSYWRTCAGTADSSVHASGTCAEDGAAWDLAGEGDADTDADSDSDSDADADSEADTDTGHCIALEAGSDWAWSGDCPGMRTPCELAQAGCAVELSYDGMTMGMPYSGTVAGDQVSFADDNSVHGCAGTAVSPSEISGTCDGCTFLLSR
jgi:hypothetical protein